MPITLVTGTPGAGKTLHTLAALVPSLMGDLQTDDGGTLKRRLCVGGVRDLLLDHEPIDVPRIRDWDQWAKSSSAEGERRPGEPPLDVPRRADNWHLWCMPGDLIVIDEAQHVFKPMAAGRALPAFISNLEEHRHYGVDFVLVTQHPNLLHANVRALVNPHLHLRRLFGRAAAAVYEWDRCSPVTAYSQCTNRRVWKHDKKAYAVYKSSELHTKFARSIPFPVVAAVLAIVAFPLVGYKALSHNFAKPESQAASSPAGTTPDKTPGQLRAVFELPHGEPAFDRHAVEPGKTWPIMIAGCWQQGDDCACVTRDEAPRIVRDRPAVCMAVVRGDLQPPPGLPRPQRVEPVATEAQSPAGVQPAPSVHPPSGA